MSHEEIKKRIEEIRSWVCWKTPIPEEETSKLLSLLNDQDSIGEKESFRRLEELVCYYSPEKELIENVCSNENRSMDWSEHWQVMIWVVLKGVTQAELVKNLKEKKAKMENDREAQYKGAGSSRYYGRHSENTERRGRETYSSGYDERRGGSRLTGSRAGYTDYRYNNSGYGQSSKSYYSFGGRGADNRNRQDDYRSDRHPDSEYREADDRKKRYREQRYVEADSPEESRYYDDSYSKEDGRPSADDYEDKDTSSDVPARQEEKFPTDSAIGYSARFKAKVAMAAYGENVSIAELARQFNVSEDKITKWKTRLVKYCHCLFLKFYDDDNPEDYLSEMHTRIGELTIRNERLSRLFNR